MKIKRFTPKRDIEEVLAVKHSWYPQNAFYKPISINIQGDLFCPVGCHACGISAQKSRSQSVSIPLEQRFNLLDQAVELGFLSYLGCIGNAEPFTSLDLLKTFIVRYGQKIDLTKINTSCFTFTSEHHAKQQLRQLIDTGWLNTVYFTPVLSLSLGMQQDGSPGVPLERIVNGIIAFHSLVQADEATLSISHYHTSTLYLESIEKLHAEYLRRTGRLLESDVVIKTNEILRAGYAEQIGAEEFPNYKLSEKVSPRQCFAENWVEYIDPVLTITETGQIQMCPPFMLNSGTILGNTHNRTIKSALLEANKSVFFRVISKYGTQLIYTVAKKHGLNVDQEAITNRHHACAALYELSKESHAMMAELEEIANFETNIP